MFPLNQLILLKTSENQRSSDVFWEHRRGTLVENGFILTWLKMFYSYFKKEFVTGLVQTYL